MPGEQLNDKQLKVVPADVTGGPDSAAAKPRSSSTAKAGGRSRNRLALVNSPVPTRDPGPTSVIDLDGFAQLSGEVPALEDYDASGQPYRVRYRGVQSRHSVRRLLLSIGLALANIAVDVLFFAWYLQPGHYDVQGNTPMLRVANIIVLITLGVVESLRLINVVSLSLASVIARDPIPVAPPAGLRVAFATTFVPDSEPYEILEKTLEAAKNIVYPNGQIDVWVLDEGNDLKVRRLCRRLGVQHFSRKGQAKWNLKAGSFKQRTKHGNYNAWLEDLEKRGIDYDVIMGVDADHVPLPSYAMRMLGYFRDEDVAFVVAPQFYGNCQDTLLTRGAESQQFPFHSLVQRAGNRYDGPMLVGTNFAIRARALQEAGGFSDSITEDMTTGISLHSSRNPKTRNRWRSVYTPDLVSVGEGPSSWSEYFNQQLRWSRGTFQSLSGFFWRRMFKMSPGKILHYILIMTFYPSMAIGWLFGILNVVLVLGLGATGLSVPILTWVMFYALATSSQLCLYVLHRDHNVSPFEKTESAGLIGMVMSILVAPMYAIALLATVFRRPLHFVVTPKGSNSRSDRPAAFRRHLGWACVILGASIAAFVRGGEPMVAFAWPLMQFMICLAPPTWSAVTRIQDARSAAAAKQAEDVAFPSTVVA